MQLTTPRILYAAYYNVSTKCLSPVSSIRKAVKIHRLSRLLREEEIGFGLNFLRPLATCPFVGINSLHVEGRKHDRPSLLQGTVTLQQISPPKRFLSQSLVYKQQRREKDIQDLVESTGKHHQGEVTVAQKVKQAGKDVSYLGVLILGFGITGVLIWYVTSELMFGFSANSVYTKASKIVKNNVEVQEAVGLPMKVFGEETSRGRRRHVSHQEYIVDGANYMRVKFYISGSKGKATVHADAKETSRGQFDFRFIFVELGLRTIIVEDKR